jgi:hypothetical protein
MRRTHLHFKRVILTFLSVFTLALTPLFPAITVSAENQFPELISKSSSGEPANANAGYKTHDVRVSDNGRYVAYLSPANNLVGQRTDTYAVYVYDRATETTTLASVNNDGVQENGHTEALSLSGNGRKVAFLTIHATNLDPQGEGGTPSVYIRDLESGTTQLASVDNNGQRISVRIGDPPSLSYDGSIVTFVSATDNKVYVRDTTQGLTQQLTAGFKPVVSANGHKVLYTAASGTLHTTQQAVVYDRYTHTYSFVGVTASGQVGNEFSGAGDISSDGRYVVFTSGASDILPGSLQCSTFNTCIYRRDLVSGSTEMINISNIGEYGTVNAGGGAETLSSDGKIAALILHDDNLLANAQLVAYDFTTGNSKVISINSTGELSDQNVRRPDVNSNGSLVAFMTDAQNFGTASQHRQIYVNVTGFTTPPDILNPSVSFPSFSLNPKAVFDTSVLSANVSDDDSGVAAVEYFIGDDPGQGNGADMFFDGTTATVTIGTDMPVGVYPYSVRALDNAGNWSDASTVFLTVYDPSGGFLTAVQSFVPSKEAGDVLPGLGDSNGIKATFGATVKYQNGSLQGNNNDFGMSFQVGNGCQNPNNNCTGIDLDATTIDWLVLTGDYTKGTFQGTADVTVGSDTTSNPYKVEVNNGDHATSPNTILVKVFAPGADPNTATPLYKASGTITGNVNVQQL